MKGHVLLTGAAGYIGNALCARLVQEGWRVTACCRRLPRGTLVKGVTYQEIGEIGPDMAWKRHLAEVDAVVHAASPVPTDEPAQGAPLEQFRHTNVDGTRTLAKAAVQAGVNHLVYLSSLKVHGESSPVPVREDSAPRPETAYARSKLEAEEVLAEIAAATSLQVTLLRPPLVYGPDCTGFFRQLLRLCSSGLPLPFGSLEARRSFVYISNLVDAIRICLAHPVTATGTFLVADGEPRPLCELIGDLCDALGKPGAVFRFPPAILSLGARLLGQEKKMRRLLAPLAVDDTRFRSALGWTPPVDPGEALRRTAAEYLRSRRRR
jgi:UDP-glucose 4-epimerase